MGTIRLKKLQVQVLAPTVSDSNSWREGQMSELQVKRSTGSGSDSYRFDGNVQASFHRFCPVNTCKGSFAQEGENLEILHKRETNTGFYTQ